MFKVPIKENEKLKTVVDRINSNSKIQTLWKSANITAIDRLNFTDHGPTHAKIVSNIALRIFRILSKYGIVSNIEKDYELAKEDAEIVIVLASALHDIGMAVHRVKHYFFSVVLATDLLNEVLEGIYSEEVKTIISTEVLHAIVSHHHDIHPLTLEAGIVRVADALDMAKGRARIPFEIGKISIHSVSALSMKK